MSFKRFIFLFVALFSGGCATYHARPLAADKTASDFEARTLTDSGLEKYLGKSPTTWDLDTLTLVAFYYHPDLDVARAQWGVAKAGEITAGERPNPTLAISPQYATNPEPGFAAWIVGVALDIPVETAGKRGYRVQQSKDLSEAARVHIARVAWQVRSRVRSSLVALQAAQESEAILQDQQKKLTANRRLLEERAAAGQVSPLTVTQAQVLSGKNEVALQDAKRQLTAARQQLAQALGLPAKALEGIHISFDDLKNPLLLDDAAFKDARDKAIRSRSDLLESLAAYAASQSALQLAIAQQYPDIHLGPGYTYDQGTHKWGLGLGSELPIFNQHKGPIAEAEARRTEAAAQFIALQDQVIGEIDRTIADYRAAREKWTTANTLLTKQLEQDESLKSLLQPGDLSRLTLFRSQLDVDSTRLVVLDALTQSQQAVGALEDALERPLSGTEPEVPFAK